MSYNLLYNAVMYPNGFPDRHGGIITFDDVLAQTLNVNVHDPYEPWKTPLYLVISKYRIYEQFDDFVRDRDTMILKLLRHGADPNLTDEEGDDMLSLYRLKCAQPSAEVVDELRSRLSPELPIVIDRAEYDKKLHEASQQFVFQRNWRRYSTKSLQRNPGEVVAEMLKWLPAGHDNAYKAFVDVAVSVCTQRMCFQDLVQKFWKRMELVLIPKYVPDTNREKMLDIFHNRLMISREKCDALLEEAKPVFERLCMVTPPEILAGHRNPCDVAAKILAFFPEDPAYDRAYCELTEMAVNASQSIDHTIFFWNYVSQSFLPKCIGEIDVDWKRQVFDIWKQPASPELKAARVLATREALKL